MSLTFLEAWRLRDKLREEVRSVRAWLLGIATNVMRMVRRPDALRAGACDGSAGTDADRGEAGG
jgi:DNA-directed RNA polymerase specialized sigma24 family protein